MKKRIIALVLASSLMVITSCAYGDLVYPGQSATSQVASNSEGGNTYHSRPDKTSQQNVSSNLAPETSSSSQNVPVSSSSKTSSSSSSKPNSSSSSKPNSSSSSSTYVPPTPSTDSHWKNLNLSLNGIDFRNALGDYIQSKKTSSCSYDSCLSIGAAAAAYPAGSNKFVPFYHDTSYTTTTGSCNREHCWPNSRGSGKSGPGADPFIIRPTLSSENSSRGNNFYGSEKSNEWDPASCGFEGSRGEAARVILYAATAWYKNGFTLTNNPSDATSLKTMGTLKFLIQWNKKYAPTEMEKQINNYLDSKGYGRNPFVDHPEWADKIWNESGMLGSTPNGEIDTPTVSISYSLVDALEDINGASLVLVSKESETVTDWYGMTNLEKAENLPWYLVGAPVTPSSDMKTMETSYTTLSKYKFEKQGDGSYTIFNSTGNKYLYGYIDGSHYSIGLSAKPTQTTSSIYWDITSAPNGGFILKNKAEVYFEYYKGSFCGFNKTPYVGTYLYK